MAQYNLMGKTELSITGIVLRNADLVQIAATVAGILGLERTEILVTDVRGENLVLDVLRRGLDPDNIVGKEKALLRSVAALPGVEIRSDARVESRGLLSWVSADPEAAKDALGNAARIATELRGRLARTVVVFPTGTELNNGQVKDTNSPAIRDQLTSEGYAVSLGPTLKDDEFHIAANLRERAEEGYGLIVTTGGVGAEDKDRTIEAILMVDPEAATPPIVKYELGVGRHVHKDSVRIAVGRLLDTLIVALPGPTDEVLLGLSALVQGLSGPPLSKADLADKIAGALRGKFHGTAGAPAAGGWGHSD